MWFLLGANEAVYTPRNSWNMWKESASLPHRGHGPAASGRARAALPHPFKPVLESRSQKSIGAAPGGS